MDKIIKMFDELKMPISWKGAVEEPSQECKDHAKKYVLHLASSYNLIPSKVAFSSCGPAIFVSYKLSSIKLGLEIDNDLDKVYVLSSPMKIIDSGLIESEYLEKRMITILNEENK